jgi:uncharacterized damage-inducible protein DinB
MSIAANLLPEFDAEFANTRKLLALVHDDHLTWKPHEKSMALGRLAWHVSDFPEWCLLTFSRDFLHFTEEVAATMMNWRGKTRADILARFDADLPKARTALAAASDAAMAQPWKLEWAGQIVIDEPRESVYRKYTVSHMVHHRAQLGVYLRLLGVPIPGFYGPSADEMPAVEAAAV